MAQPTHVTDAAERARVLLEYDHHMLDELAEIAVQWDRLEEGERVSWSLDWDQVVGVHLRFLEASLQEKTLPQALVTRYRDLLDRLRRSLPIIAKLGLYAPPVALDLTPRAPAGALPTASGQS